MKLSSIGWTDYSGGALNFIHGCTPVSEGCAHCYARAVYERFGLDFAPRFDADKLARLETLRFPEYSPKRGAPHKPMAFVCDTGDVLHESIPNDVVAQSLDVMAMRHDVTWQILTKRIERMNQILSYMGECWPGDSPYNIMSDADPRGAPPNIWLGVTVENQARADERIPALLATPAAVHFVSIEPCLGPVDLTAIDCDSILAAFSWVSRVDWVIVGGESGPNRRPFDALWALDLYAQCKSAGVPFFYKQSGALRPGQEDDLPGIGKVKEWPE